MRKVVLSLLCALAVLATASVSDANIFVSISDGTNTVSASKGGLVLSKTSPAPAGTLDVTDTLNILTCAAPCQVGFPSGILAPNIPASDTFIIENVTGTRARIEKFDSGASADRVSLKGVKFTARTAGKVLTVTYGNLAGDLRALTSAQAASYSVSAAFSGFFRTSAGLRASACKLGTVSTDMDEAIEACVRLSITLNGTSVNGQGTSPSTTVAVPCNNAFPTVNPCGTGGLWTSANGTFTGINDGKSISCPSACSPAHRATLTARFNAINDVLQLTASTHGAMANVPDEKGGVEETAIALGSEIGFNRWVTHSSSIERCRAEPKSPAINDTRNVSNNSSLPISFEYWCGVLSPAGAEGVPLVSLADDARLPGAASTRYEASRETFLPAPNTLQFKSINTLSFAYQVAVGTEQVAVERRLGPLTYTDCKDGSIRLEIQLVDKDGVNLGILRVYLGSTDNFKDGCAAVASVVGADIRNNPDARVDGSELLGGLRTTVPGTFRSFQNGQVGNAFVRKIAFVVSRPVSPVSDPNENYKVTFFDGNVNGVTALSSLQKVTGEVRITDLSPNGVSITITKLTSPGNLGTGIVKVVPSSQIQIIGGKFTTSVSVNEISAESGAQYGISLCPNGTEENSSLADNTVLGVCIADQAIMTLL
jgi:hypothetical protein